MPTQSRNTGNAQFIPDDLSVDAMRDELLKAKLDAARQPAIESAFELYSFVSSLPDAYAASLQREAERLKKSGKDNAPRLEALKASIDEADKLRLTARAGQARVERALAGLAEPNDVFHGFVSDTELRPQQGYTVRVVGAGDAEGKSALTAKTGSDGYFSITLKENKKTSGFSAKDETHDILFAQISKLFGMSGQAAATETRASSTAFKTETVASRAESATFSKTETAQAGVEILDPDGQLIHQDPIPIHFDEGSIYREYVVESKDNSSGKKRYAGNPASRELHDMQKISRRCNFKTINPGEVVYFDTTEAAEKAGYDYCAYCFGKAKSKR